LHNNDLF